MNKTNDPLYVPYPAFIRMIAKESGFTIADTRIFMKGFVAVMLRIIQQRKNLLIPNLFTMRIKEIPAYRGWDQVHKKWYDRKKSLMVKFRSSKKLVRLIKENKDLVEDFYESLAAKGINFWEKSDNEEEE